MEFWKSINLLIYEVWLLYTIGTQRAFDQKYNFFPKRPFSFLVDHPYPYLVPLKTQPFLYLSMAQPFFLLILITFIIFVTFIKLFMASNKPLVAWFHGLTRKLLNLNFTPSKFDISLFIHTTPTNTNFLLVYVDDIQVTSSSQSFLSSLISDLNATFCLKDLGSLHYFLGIEAIFTPNGLSLTQTKYTKIF